jgi:hypothetical protein
VHPRRFVPPWGMNWRGWVHPRRFVPPWGMNWRGCCCCRQFDSAVELRAARSRRSDRQSTAADHCAELEFRVLAPLWGAPDEPEFHRWAKERWGHFAMHRPGDGAAGRWHEGLRTVASRGSCPG